MRTLLTILFILLTSTVAADSNFPKYERKNYRHWIDEDRDCQNARHQVLIEKSLYSGWVQVFKRL